LPDSSTSTNNYDAANAESAFVATSTDADDGGEEEKSGGRQKKGILG
jgi:hypothetical protein